MNRQEAKTKAMELWALKGSIFDRLEDSKVVTDWHGAPRYWVGNGPATINELMELDELKWFSGNGNTWEEAFANVREVTF